MRPEQGETVRGVSRRHFLQGIGATSVAGGLLSGTVPDEGFAADPAMPVGPGEVSITLNINGQDKSVSVEPRTTLLDALRDRLGLTGSKKVCDRGTCGACTVLKDGRPVYACSILAIDAQGTKITTIEGLGVPDKLSPVQAAFVKNDAQQCGFCTPGFVVASTAFLAKTPEPTPEQVLAGLGGNLCRCGTYEGIKLAVLDASKAMKGGRVMANIHWPSQEKRRLLGTRIDRLDGPVKASGAARYSYDIQRPDMLHAKILGAPIAAGTLKSLDTKAAEAMKGVAAIHVMMKPGSPIQWAGQEILALAAVTEEIAKEALTKIKVVCEPGKPQMNDADPSKVEGRERSRTEGEPDKAFGEAAATVEGRYGLAAITHCCLEAHGQVCEIRDGALYVWPSTQNVSGYAGQVAGAAGVPSNKVHVDCQYMGGGFGAKFGADSWGVVCTELAKKSGKPVKLMLDRDLELMIAGHRPSAYADVKIAALKDGTVTAWESKSWGSGGIGGFGAPPLPYVFNIPNRKTGSQSISVNRGPARAWRAPGHPQGCLITMAAMEDLAAKLGIDALEFFLKNLQYTSDELRNVYRDELMIAAEMIGYKQKAHLRGDKTPGPIKRGLGMSIHTWGGAGHASACDVTIQPDGSVIANIGTQDLGTGTRTAIGIVVAETLGLPLDAVQVNIGRSSYPPDGASGGSTTIGGISSSSRRAATAALNDLLARVAKELGIDAEKLEAADGKVQEVGNPAKSIPWKKACSLLGQISITQQGKHVAGGRTELTSSGVGGCQIADVSVDIETGIVRVNEIAAAQDCGLIVDLKTAESQVYGALIMGVTYAVYEEIIYDPLTGRMLNPDMEFYKLAGLADVGKLKVHMMTGKGYDERGVIGLGEPPVIPPGAAISNAVANAIGVRVPTLPLTPDKVLAALAKGGARA